MQEPDSSKSAWSFYKSVYTEDHWSLIKEFDLENICTYQERKHKENKEVLRYSAYIRSDSSYADKEYLNSEFSLAGDCDFNFNKYKTRKFRDIIDSSNSSEDIKNYLKEKLLKCYSLHHNNLNFSLIPQTGAMNIFKGRVYFNCNEHLEYKNQEYGDDRLDTFVYCLNKLFVNKDEMVLSASKP